MEYRHGVIEFAVAAFQPAPRQPRHEEMIISLRKELSNTVSDADAVHARYAPSAYSRQLLSLRRIGADARAVRQAMDGDDGAPFERPAPWRLRMRQASGGAGTLAVPSAGLDRCCSASTSSSLAPIRQLPDAQAQRASRH
jgi:hypothetical protein